MNANSTSAIQVCGYCGGWHTGMCPRVKSIDYYPDGTIRRVELHDALSVWPTPVDGEQTA